MFCHILNTNVCTTENQLFLCLFLYEDDEKMVIILHIYIYFLCFMEIIFLHFFFIKKRKIFERETQPLCGWIRTIFPSSRETFNLQMFFRRHILMDLRDVSCNPCVILTDQFSLFNSFALKKGKWDTFIFKPWIIFFFFNTFYFPCKPFP